MPKPLEGVTIISLEHFVAGPFGTMLLADFGADVIRIERPGVGEPMRVPQVSAKDGQVVPLVYYINNRNKRSVVLDLKSEQGQKILRELIAKADVLVENLSPEALERMGLGWDALQELNPRLIYLTVSGFGRTDLDPGPLTDRPALDFIAQAMSGLMWGPTFGKEPLWLGFAVPDLGTGMMAALGLMAALRERDRTGEGQRVDVSMYDVATMLNDKNLAFYASAGRDAASLSEITNQLGTYQTLDGYAVIGVVSNVLWPKVAAMIGRPGLGSDPDLATLKLRAQRYDTVVRPAVAEWAATRTRSDVVDSFLGIGIPAGPVQTSGEVLDCPHHKARHQVHTFDTDHGPVTTIANPVRFKGEKLPMRMPPRLGADSEAVLRDLLGYSAEDIADLRRQEVIGPQ